MTPWYMLALWGLLGSFIYAAPRFSACFFSARQNGGTSLACGVELAISLAIGTIASPLIAPWLQHFLDRQGSHETMAISAVIGLLANPVTPRLLNVDTLISMLKSLKGPVP